MSEFGGLWKQKYPACICTPRIQNVAAQVAEDFKTVTYATPPMEERRKKKEKLI